MVRIYFLQRFSFHIPILTYRDRKYHDKFRRIFGPAFTNTTLMKYEPNIREHLNRAIRAITASALKGPVDMTSYCKYFVTDVRLTYFNADVSGFC